GPWHMAHFALYVASAAAASAFAGALRKTMVADATAATMIPGIQLIVFRIFFSFNISAPSEMPRAAVAKFYYIQTTKPVVLFFFSPCLFYLIQLFFSPLFSTPTRLRIPPRVAGFAKCKKTAQPPSEK